MIFEVTLFVFYFSFFTLSVGFGLFVLHYFEFSVQNIPQDSIPLDVFIVNAPQAVSVFRGDGISDLRRAF